MSWDQDYSIESYLQLLIKLTGKHPEELLESYLAMSKGLRVVDKKTIILADGMYGDVRGEQITLSDGRVFLPKLVERFNENGNHGIDVYEYHLDSETPEVMNIGLDTSDLEVDIYSVPDAFGEETDTHGWEG